ncbi:hypothetical protein B0H14DRAFT_210041 [Mycena olivaceomarginata]|nr:hypothetical protein B0H14DRAFT_210041 [Mycena olivaceomarginata]
MPEILLAKPGWRTVTQRSANHPGYSLNPHGVPVQYTDDAVSKETQYLRRRCFNCHMTEPPSWRRSTLNPGKIVCNKCGLYERTHLRARPRMFDELRAMNKARKGGPKQGPAAGGVKKAGGAIARRSSASSTRSSAQSGSGASDWDDSVSVYSNSHSSAASAYSQSPVPPSLSSSSSHNTSPGRDSLSRSPPPLLHPGQGHPGSPPGSAGSYNGHFVHYSPRQLSPAPDPRAAVRSWTIWQPDPDIAPTPPASSAGLTEGDFDIGRIPEIGWELGCAALPAAQPTFPGSEFLSLDGSYEVEMGEFGEQALGGELDLYFGNLGMGELDEMLTDGF